jgi:hypothetical protein
VSSDRSRSAKTLVGTSQINSLALLGFTESTPQRASPSENQHSQQSSKQQRRRPTSTTSRPAIAINRRPVASRTPPQAPHNANCVFTEFVNRSAYHLQPSINCGDPPPPQEFYNGIPNITVWRVLRKRLHLKAYKLSAVEGVEGYT